MATGPHELTVDLVSSDGRGYYELPPVAFSVTG